MNGDFTAAIAALENSDPHSERFSGTFVTFLPISGAAVSTLGEVLGSETISATDAHAARLDEVQFDLGEGPCWDALDAAGPIAEPSLRVTGAERWPAFAAAIRDEPVSSIFAFPLIVGPLRLGAVDLYSRTPVTLDSAETQRASTLAAVVARRVLRDALSASDSPTDADANPRTRRLIHQATGIVLAQLDLRPDDALLIIQGHAFATNRSMMEVATEIVEGRLAFRSRSGRIEVLP